MNQAPENNLVNEEETPETTQYFSVGLSKLIIMSICTLGIYELYWFYKNWVHIKKSDNSDILPFWRAFFAPIWAYFSFERIQEDINELKLNVALSTVFMAIAYFLLNLLSALPDPYWLISFFSFLAILPANEAITKINEKQVDGFEQNSTIQGWNWLAVVLGGALMIMSILGTFAIQQV